MNRNTKLFKPFKLIIDVNTIEDLTLLYSIFNQSENTLLDFVEEENDNSFQIDLKKVKDTASTQTIWEELEIIRKEYFDSLEEDEEENDVDIEEMNEPDKFNTPCDDPNWNGDCDGCTNYEVDED